MALALIAALPALDRVMGIWDMLVVLAAVATVALALASLEQAGSNAAYVMLSRNKGQRD